MTPRLVREACSCGGFLLRVVSVDPALNHDAWLVDVSVRCRSCGRVTREPDAEGLTPAEAWLREFHQSQLAALDRQLVAARAEMVEALAALNG